MKGKRSIIKVGTNDNAKSNGSDIDSFKFLKNSISSNKFRISPKARKTKIVIKKILKNFTIKYLLIILFILQFVQSLFFLKGRYKKEKI